MHWLFVVALQRRSARATKLWHRRPRRKRHSRTTVFHAAPRHAPASFRIGVSGRKRFDDGFGAGAAATCVEVVATLPVGGGPGSTVASTAGPPGSLAVAVATGLSMSLCGDEQPSARAASKP
jgi:hypothetical protein